MGGYDLYGNYYTRTIDALNAEDAQCARIDARIAEEKQQRLDYEMGILVDHLKEENELLKKRVEELEKES